MLARYVVLIVAVVLCMPQQANAAQVIATVTGTVTYGIDGQTGGPASSSIFGFPPGTQMAGSPYTAVYALDTIAGVPFDAQTPCINSLESFGLNNTPVPKAKITINGSTYTFGTSTPTSVYSYVQAYGAPASKPKNSLVFQFHDTGPSSKQETLYADISLNSLNQYVCRNWADAFNYALQSSDEPSSGNFDIIVPGQSPGSSNQYAFANLNVSTVTVSGPMTAECLQAVTGAVSIAVEGEGGKSIFAKFKPKGGLVNAENACGVKFNWQQWIEELPGASPYYPIDTQLAPGNTTLTTANGAAITFKGVPDPKSPPYIAPPRFLDPQPGGYLIANVDAKEFVPDASDAFPFYLDTARLKINTLSNALCFSDLPFDPFLPSNKFLLFTTLLVGFKAETPKEVSNYYASWQWESNNTNSDVSTAGGVTLINLPQATGMLGCPEE